jgi:uncharacterized protein (TIGR04255 family)
MNNPVLIRRKYKKPSIQEAIFEAKFIYDTESFSVTTPGQIFEKIKDHYPKQHDIKHIPIFLEDPENTKQLPFFIQAPVLQARKEDDSELLQVGPGIALANQLKYSSWENFIPSIRTVLDAYLSSVNPNVVTRIGTRYINSFLIPHENINILDYFNLGVQIPATLSQFQGFDLTFINKIKSVIDNNGPHFEIRTKFFTDSLRPNEIGNKLILDIDCYVTKEYDPKIEKIISLATQAHHTLEMVFESIITEKTRELMEIEQ